jgi:uncharacterized membrane protein SpoIIM required for sporulation
MKVAERLQQRESGWQELDSLIERVSHKGRRRPAVQDVLRMGALYRSACADLMLADDHDLPRETVSYLHALVGRGHNLIYSATGFNFRDWGRAIFQTAPARLRSDPCLRIAALVFWGAFLMSALLAAGRDGFAASVVTEPGLEQMDQMYAEPVNAPQRDDMERSDTMMAGFYIWHNAGIGLRCFAWGIVFGLGSLKELLFEGIVLGTVFGHMATTAHAANFFTFVTAHSSFELTAIVLSGAAGLRMGWGLIDTQGQSRLASLRCQATRALPAVGVAVVLFVLAALVEGYVSASTLPYWSKAAVALLSAFAIIAYLMLGGSRRDLGEDQGPRFAADTEALA